MKTKQEREQFFSQEHLPLEGYVKTDLFDAYRLKDTQQAIIEYTIDSGLGGEEVEIAQITDIHFNYCNADDENDEEVMLTKKCRKYVANGASAEPAKKAMDAAEYFDQTVVTGDTLDYLSCGAIELADKLIFKRDPDVLVPLGGHDYLKNMETGKPEKYTFEEKAPILEKAWIHDIHYESRVIKNKVLAVAIDNGTQHYHPSAVAKLKADIERARKGNLAILIFQHEPICTGKPEDDNREGQLILYTEKYNFYSDPAVCSKELSTDTDREIYKLITENADVIKCICCGHLHSVFVTDVKAYYTDKDGARRQTSIPQYATAGNTYFGMQGVVTRIIVK